MKLNFNKNHHLAVVIAAVLTAVALGLIGYKLHHIKREVLKSEPLVTSADLAPLTIVNTKALRLPILMYHHIGDLPPRYGPVRLDLTVPPEQFSEEVQKFKALGYHSISLNDFFLYLQGKLTLPSKPLIFTFDDGYNDVFKNAIPIMKAAGFSGTFAIITGYPGQTQADNFYASWPDIEQAKKDGMEIICHTQNHFDAKDPKYTTDYIYQNLSGCQKDIAGHLGAAEPFMIYPYGHYTPAYLEQVKKIGFVLGLTVHEGSLIDPENLLEMPRVRVHRNEPIDKLLEMMNLPK